MRVQLGDHGAPFRPWRPGDGRVFQSAFAFDCETALIDDSRPWIVPPYVLGAAYDGTQGVFLTRDTTRAFFEVNTCVPVIMHHAVFDLRVLKTLAHELDVYGWVDRDRVRDTQLLHRLYVLGTAGHTARGRGESTLEQCVETYLGVPLPKDVTDSAGDLVRTSYGKWLGRPPAEIESVYLEYLAKDVMGTFGVYEVLTRLINALLLQASEAFGYVSLAWLEEQCRRWGPLTHNIQLKASIVLEEISANGLYVDLARREELVAILTAKKADFETELRQYGFLPGQTGNRKVLQQILARLERENRGIEFSRTPSGLYASSQESLADFDGVDPFVTAFLQYSSVSQLLATFLAKMGKQTLHPDFNVLVNSGRTSSFGEINAQNLPRDDRIRSCFQASPGYTLIAADYKAVEMVTLAQACETQFGLSSKLAELLNLGVDPHCTFAAHVGQKQPADVSKEERQKVKAINFGKPGGMGNRALQAYAKSSYGVDLPEDQVAELAEAWMTWLPEMKEFLADDIDLSAVTAEFFGLTPQSHFEHTFDNRFLTHPNNGGREGLPHPILGSMCLKTLKEELPRTQYGQLYSAADVDYFWTKVLGATDELPDKVRTDIAHRRASPELKWMIVRAIARRPVFTLTGRLRAKATYSACRNTVFQGLAADGAKIAMWRLWRAGYRIVNFIHDEFLIEVPESADLDAVAKEVRSLMIEAMQEVTPDMKVEVELAATRRWSKAAKPVYDGVGHLQVWHPMEETVVCEATSYQLTTKSEIPRRLLT